MDSEDLENLLCKDLDLFTASTPLADLYFRSCSSLPDNFFDELSAEKHNLDFLDVCFDEHSSRANAQNTINSASASAMALEGEEKDFSDTLKFLSMQNSPPALAAATQSPIQTLELKSKLHTTIAQITLC